MDVISHVAVGVQPRPEPTQYLVYQSTQRVSILDTEEDRLPVIAP